MTLREAVKAAMEYKGISAYRLVKDLAKYGITKSAFSIWISGKGKTLSAEKVEGIIAYLGCIKFTATTRQKGKVGETECAEPWISAEQGREI